MQSSIYATPLEVNDLAECWFYHTIEVPGVGVMPGEWDLRAGVDEYLGKVPLAGKRVLELGTASGFLCFEMEKRGADVVAFDLTPGGAIDLIPLASFADMQSLTDQLRGPSGPLHRLHNSFWYCHRRFHSAAKVVYGNIYDLPAEIGHVDVATFGSILLHLRDPFLALANAARFTRSTIVVTDLLHDNPWDPRIVGTPDIPNPTPAAAPVPPVRRSLFQRAKGRLKRVARAALGRPEPVAIVPPPPPPLPPSIPALVFLPDASDPMLPSRLNSWWQFSPEVIRRMLGVLGFEDTTTTTHQHTFHYQGGSHTIRLFTVVARRTQPQPKRIDGPYPWV